MKKAILHILYGKEKRITDEDIVRQSLPQMTFRFANPFIVVHHMGPKEIPPGSNAKMYPHPHRGFSPVTFLIAGQVEHKDNVGNIGHIEAGDAQWLFAGKGLLHDEIPPKQFLQTGGTQELLQLWINVPKANKWDEPAYQIAKRKEQPQVLSGEGIDLHLISGIYEGKTGPLKMHTPVLFIEGTVQKDKQSMFTVTPNYWTLLYITRGTVIINGETEVGMYNLVVFEKEHEEITITAKEDTRILLMSAEPIEEPVAAKGNFVMNTEEEIRQAIADYEQGKFGEWTWT